MGIPETEFDILGLATKLTAALLDCKQSSGVVFYMEEVLEETLVDGMCMCKAPQSNNEVSLMYVSLSPDDSFDGEVTITNPRVSR